MSKSTPSLSDRDKTPATSGWGYHFHHTNPQRRVPCVLGDMLAPLSADDIPPITPKAMASVQAALALLANLVGDRDHGRFLGCSDAQLEEYREKARDILRTARALAGILRVGVSEQPMSAAELPAVPTALITPAVAPTAPPATPTSRAPTPTPHAATPTLDTPPPTAVKDRDTAMETIGKVLAAAHGKEL